MAPKGRLKEMKEKNDKVAQLVNEVADHTEAQQWRECGDAYLTLYQLVGGKDPKFSWWALHGYTNCLIDKKGMPPTKEDSDFLNRTFRDETVYVEQRVRVGYALANIDIRNARNTTSVAACRATLKLIMHEAERSRPVRDQSQDPSFHGTCNSTAGELFNRQCSLVQALLDHLLSVGAAPVSTFDPKIDNADQPCGSGGFLMPRAYGGVHEGHCLSVGPAAPPGLTPAVVAGYIHESTRPRGTQCDHCGFAAAMTYKICKQCKRKAYCSAECQKEDWNGGHKARCRAPKDFAANDLVRICAFNAHPELNGMIVVVHAMAMTCGEEEPSAKQWAVGVVGADLTSCMSIPEANLALVIPVEERVDLG